MVYEISLSTSNTLYILMDTLRCKESRPIMNFETLTFVKNEEDLNLLMAILFNY